MRASLLVAALAAHLSLAASLCAAESEDDAGSLFRRGRTAMKRGDCASALPLFSESQGLDPSVGTALNLAICEEQSKRFVAAIEHFTYVASGTSTKDSRRAFAERRVQALEERVARITIELPRRRGRTQILLDGKALADADLAAPIRVDPGLHQLTLRVDDEVQVEEKLELREGERRAWLPRLPEEFAPSREPLPEPLPTNPPPLNAKPAGASNERSGSPVAGYAFIGVGAAALATSLVLGYFVIQKDRTSKDNCNGDACNQVGSDAAKDGKTLSTLATISGAIAIPALGVGTYLVLSYDRPSSSQAAAMRGPGGRFVLSVPFE